MARLAHHLNFYMNYFDAYAPAVFIHPPELAAVKPRTRYLAGSFPSRIDARIIDDDLLQLWSGARSGDAGRRFVYYYRIVEYVSHGYIERDARARVRKMLSSPNAFSDIGMLVDNVVTTALAANSDEIPRILNLLRDAVDPALLWAEIEKNRDAFQDRVTFDGGYVLDPLINRNHTQEVFVTGGVDRFATMARQIRNQLSHGRDKSTQTSITPTTENFRRLEPWVAAISVVAGEVVTYRHAL